MSAARRDAFSRPVFDQTIRIQSNPESATEEPPEPDAEI